MTSSWVSSKMDDSLIDKYPHFTLRPAEILKNGPGLQNRDFPCVGIRDFQARSG